MKKLWGVLFVVAVCVAFAATAAAQTQITTGVVQGTVLDPSGAVVPGADVEVKNLDTNLTRTLTTDADGRFVALLLPSGRYTVKITKQGFATLVQENVNLTVGQAITLTLNMKISTAAETITVTATPIVETVKVEAATTLSEITVATTPVLGRKFEDLLTLTPGVSISQGPDGDVINFVGQRGIFTNVSLDGGDYINGFFGEQVGGQRAAVDITMEAVKEFQVVVTGGSAEFGRTAGGVVNVVTKSGGNEFHGSLFHYQRMEALTANDSLDRPLTDFHREQSGGSVSGPFAKDKAWWFIAVEQINGNLQRSNLSVVPTGATSCSVTTWTPTGGSVAPLLNATNINLLNTNADCQRRALVAFMRATRNQVEDLPIRRPLHNTAVFGRMDYQLTPSNNVNVSYNFNRSVKINETFDVDTYGNSANGIEGASRIQVFNANWFTTIRPTVLNEAHFTYTRELRPRAAVDSNIPPDTAMGIEDSSFAPNGPFSRAFRFGSPFFLGPTIDELFWRTQIRDNFSIVSGKHTMKFGGEWIHSRNVQVFRGFFLGRYIFNSVEGFLRYASPQAVGGFGPTAAECSNGTFATLGLGETCASGYTGGPLVLYLQGAGRTGPATDAAGASDIDNEEYALFVQDKWQLRSNFTVNAGVRWEAQIFPAPVVPPAQTAYGAFLSDPRFPSDGTLHSQKKMFQPRVGFAWDARNNGKSVLRASWGIYNARQNMLTQVGSITTNGVQQQTIFISTDLIRQGFAAGTPVWPGVVSPPVLPAGQFPLFSGVRVFAKDYRNPRVYSSNIAYEQEIARDTSFYADYTMAKGVYLTRFLDVNGGGSGPFGLQLGEVFTASSLGKSLYRGVTLGLRKRFSNRFQLEANYVYAVDKDDDSNERDPFTDRACDNSNLSLDYANSDRDIRHKFNFFGFFELPWKFELNTRMQGRSAQPTPAQPELVGMACGTRNSQRKDNKFFSFDWRLQRPIALGERFKLIPTIEMFNTFNNTNNINPLSAPALYNFDGFLREGVGDPLQVQFAIKFTW